VERHARHGIAYRDRRAGLGDQQRRQGRHLSVVHSGPVLAEPSRDAIGRLDRSELAALEQALGQAALCARAAYDDREPWADRVRASLSALLELFDAEPKLAKLCVVRSAMIGTGALARREEILAGLARVIDAGRDSTRRQQPPPLTARGVVAGAIGAVRARLQEPEPEPLIELLNPLMSFIVLPYLGAAAARRQLSRPVPRREPRTVRSSRKPA